MEENVLTFKDMMHKPILIEGDGKCDELIETIGEYNVNRLRDLGLIKTINGEFSLTEQGKKFIEVFNRG